MPARTRACALCKKKRIKCDATLPSCNLCRLTGPTCPGPISGPVLIDMTSTAGKGAQPQKRKHKPKEPGRFQDSPFLCDVQMPSHISQRNIMHEAFYGNFLVYFTSAGEGRDLQNRMTWLHRLPRFSTDGTYEALLLALQATASAHCAAESRNIALLNSARHTYGLALREHSRLIRSHQPAGKVNVHMISTSVLLSLFEGMHATTSDAYRSHISAAAKMIEMADAGKCAEGILCQLFFHIRTQMAFVYLTTTKGTNVQVRKILRQTLAYKKLPIVQRLMTCIITLSEIYVKQQAQPAPDCSSEEQHNAQPPTTLLHLYATIKSELALLWAEYTGSATQTNEPLFWTDPTTSTSRYRDPFTALTLAYFSAAHILLSVLSPPPYFAAPVLDHFTDHYAVILDVVRHLETYRIGCAYMRMATPLFLVARHAPRGEQREEAVGVFEGWGSGGMMGISALALEGLGCGGGGTGGDRTA